MNIGPEAQKQLAEQGSKAISAVTGGAAHELSMLLGQHVAFWRFKNAVAIAVKAHEYIISKGINPQNLPPKLRDIVPIVEYGSMEDEPPLHDMWASLLASTVMPEYTDQVQPKFHELLRQITSSEARMLLWLHEDEFVSDDLVYIHTDTRQTMQHLNISKDEATSLALNLIRLGLVRGQEHFNGYPNVEKVEMVTLTAIGRHFVERCTLIKM